MTAPYHFYKQQMLQPEVYQAQLMAKFVQGKFLERGEVVSPFLRAQVVSFDPVGGLLENPGATGTARSRNPDNGNYCYIKARTGPTNPSRAIRARIVTSHMDANVLDEDLRIYWPMFPATGPDPVSLDFVYVFFEQNDRKHGLWVSRVPGPLGEKTNYTPGDKTYKDAATGSNDQPLAAAHGDASTSNSNEVSNESIVGSKSDDSSLSDLDYTAF